MAAESGMLCVTRRNSTSTLPMRIFSRQMIFIQTFLHHRHGEARAVTRREVEGRQQVLRRADVIEVSVRKEDCFDAVLSSFQAGNVRNQVVDSQHILVRELESQVDDVDVLIHFYDEAVAADLFKTTERVDPEILFLATRSSDRPMLWLARRGI